MLNYLRPEEGAFIILESFTNTPHKTIHVVSFKEDDVKNKDAMEFVVGRDNNVQIRITDISVSRAHASISYHEGEFYVRDIDSKFGTLVLLQGPFPIPYVPKWDLTIQTGKYLSKLIT